MKLVLETYNDYSPTNYYAIEYSSKETLQIYLDTLNKIAKDNKKGSFKLGDYISISTYNPKSNSKHNILTLDEWFEENKIEIL